MMEVILDVQGFKVPDNEFVVKELAIVKLQKDGREEVNCIFIIKPPCEWNSLPAKYKSQNLWCQRNYHGIPWNAGDISYDELIDILDTILKDVGNIYVKGLEKTLWVAKIIGTSVPIINLEVMDCPALRDLSVPTCQHKKYHSGVERYNCAFENVQRLKNWYLENCVPSFGRSIKIFCELGKLTEMRIEDIACLTKEFILTFAWEQIDDAWDKLPKEMQADEAVMLYRRCQKHHLNTENSDAFDGPVPFIINCPMCNNRPEERMRRNLMTVGELKKKLKEEEEEEKEKRGILKFFNMEDFTPDEIIRLTSLPPYFNNYEDAIEKHFGDVPPDSIYNFLTDVLDFQTNLESVRSEREKNESADEGLCYMCDSIETINMHVRNLYYPVVELEIYLSQLKRDIQANRYVFFEDEPINGVIEKTEILQTYVKKLSEYIMTRKTAKKT